MKAELQLELLMLLAGEDATCASVEVNCTHFTGRLGVIQVTSMLRSYPPQL